MTVTPPLRTRAFDLIVIPPRLPQPPPQQDEWARERAEDAAPRADAVPRRALRPDRALKPLLQHVVILVRRRICGNYARERSGAHGREELEDERDLGFLREYRRCVASTRVRTYYNRTGQCQ